MTAFAANSVLARLALGDGEADAGSFTVVRLASGALVLAALASRHTPPRQWLAFGSWTSAAMLVVYATAFSYAYLRLGAGTGALVLFAAVQTVIFAAALRAGERPGRRGWLGLVLAGLGMVTLAAPSATAPDALGLILMIAAGSAWAVYTLRGRGTTRPVDATAANFVRGAPLAVAVVIPLVALAPDSGVHMSPQGAGLALLSGIVASGLGYAVWYLVLPRLTRVQSGLVQLTPAPLAMVAGLLLLSEPITGQVLLASVLILGGVALGVTRTSAAAGTPQAAQEP